MKNAFLTSIVLTASALACDHDHDEEPIVDACGEPAYGGDTSDEAWMAVVDAYDRAEIGTADAVTITSPAPATVVPATGPAPSFAWTSPLAAAPILPRALALAPISGASEGSWWLDALDALGGFFVGRAHAHLPPVTGDVYYVELRISGRECAVRAFTTEQSWTPDAQDWATLKANVGVPIELVITSAYLSENRVTEGPFRPATALTFEVR